MASIYYYVDAGKTVIADTHRSSVRQLTGRDELTTQDFYALQALGFKMIDVRAEFPF